MEDEFSKQNESEIFKNLIFLDVETAELLLLPFAGDGQRARDELVEQSSHHFFRSFDQDPSERFEIFQNETLE